MNFEPFLVFLVLLLKVKLCEATSTSTLPSSKKQKFDSFPEVPSGVEASPDLFELVENLFAYPIRTVHERLRDLSPIEWKKSVKPHCEWNILHEAIYIDHVALVESLLEDFGFDVNEWNDTFGTCIFLVKSAEMARILIRFGANTEVTRASELYSSFSDSYTRRLSGVFSSIIPRDSERQRAAYLQALEESQRSRPKREFKAKKAKIYEFVLDKVAEMSELMPSSKMIVKYTDESGLDRGGLSLDLISFLKDKIVNDSDFLTLLDSGVYDLKQNAPDNKAKLLGFLFGLSIYQRVPLNMQFAPILYLLPFARNIHRDINFVSVLFETDGDARKHFETMKELFGDKSINFLDIPHTNPRDWKPIRDTVVESRSDLAEFLKLLAEFRVYGIRARAYKNFLFGLARAIDISQLRDFLIPDEFKDLLLGINDYSAQQFRDNVKFENEEVYKTQYDWLIEIIDEMDQRQRSKFLKFMTALEILPIGGFSSLKRQPNVCVLVTDDSDRKLPLSATCSFTLMLQPYSSKDIMKGKILLAIEECNSFALR